MSAGPGRSVRDGGHLPFEGGYTARRARWGMQAECATDDSGQKTQGLPGCHLLLTIEIGFHASVYEDDVQRG